MKRNVLSGAAVCLAILVENIKEETLHLCPPHAVKTSIIYNRQNVKSIYKLIEHGLTRQLLQSKSSLICAAACMNLGNITYKMKSSQKIRHCMHLFTWMSRKGIPTYRKKTVNCLQGTCGYKFILGWHTHFWLNHSHSCKWHMFHNLLNCML